MKKLIICTIPKSGTYMVSEMLKNVGYEHVRYHLLSTGGVSDYRGASLQESRNHPEKYAKSISFGDVFDEIVEGQFVVGHVGPGSVGKFDVFPLFVKRNLRAVIVSFARWTIKAKRWGWDRKEVNPDNLVHFLRTYGKPVFSMIESVCAWANTEVDTFEFSRLRGQVSEEVQEEEIKRMMVACELDVKQWKNAVEAIGKDTLTFSGGLSVWSPHWNGDVEEVFCGLGFDDLNKKLGYE